MEVQCLAALGLLYVIVYLCVLFRTFDIVAILFDWLYLLHPGRVA